MIKIKIPGTYNSDLPPSSKNSVQKELPIKPRLKLWHPSKRQLFKTEKKSTT